MLYTNRYYTLPFIYIYLCIPVYTWIYLCIPQQVCMGVHTCAPYYLFVTCNELACHQPPSLSPATCQPLTCNHGIPVYITPVIQVTSSLPHLSPITGDLHHTQNPRLLPFLSPPVTVTAVADGSGDAYRGEVTRVTVKVTGKGRGPRHQYSTPLPLANRVTDVAGPVSMVTVVGIHAPG